MYLEISERKDKSKIHDKESIKVVTSANETQEALGLKANFMVDTNISYDIKDIGKTMAIISNIVTTS